MPCLFFCNWESNTAGFHPAHINQVVRDNLFKTIAKAAGVPITEIELHFVEGKYWVWKYDGGNVEDHHGVHVFIEWHGGRDFTAKFKIAQAIHEFLHLNGMGKGSDITFRDSPSETFFYEGNLVSGGPPRN